MTCPFCGMDPFEYVDVGIGSVPVAVVCCNYGYRLFQLNEDYNLLRWKWEVEAARDYLHHAWALVADQAKVFEPDYSKYIPF